MVGDAEKTSLCSVVLLAEVEGVGGLIFRKERGKDIRICNFLFLTLWLIHIFASAYIT